MKKYILYSLIFLVLSFFAASVAAQTRETGHEAMRAEMNFMDVAAYFRAHPMPLVRQPIENDEENDEKPAHGPVDTSLVRYRSYTRMGGRSAFLPISPSPTDSFESTIDPGTSIPPDTHGAVDSNYCITTINTTVKIQTRAGALVSTMTLDAFWNPVLPGGGSFDPRVHYDPYTNRWILVAVSGGQTTSSAILIAISKTSNPTAGWWQYNIVADATTVNWLDFPDVGFNGKWVTITGNYFAVSGGAYHGAKTFVFNKANLLAGVGASYTSFLHTTSFTICPALTYDATLQSMFAVETWDGTAAGGGTMELWKITGAVGSEAMTSVAFPASAGVNWQDGSFAVTGSSGADFAPQTGTANKLQTNDDRVDQMVYINGKLWFAHTVWLPYSTSVNATRSSIQWWEIDTTGTPIQDALIDDPTNANFYAFPSLAVNTNNDALVGFAAFSATTHPSSAYALHMHTDPVDAMRPLFIYRHGLNTYYKTFSGTKDRWGDYSGTAVDPLDMTDFWTIQEASAATANTWDTWWAYVKLCSPPDTIAGTTTICAGTTTTLTDDSVGGTWNSSSSTITIGSTSGVVNGVSAGSAIITYSLTGGCTTTATVTVHPLPATISGPTGLCTGTSATLTDLTIGGAWSSSNTGVAAFGSSAGLLNGLSVGTSIITYQLPTGCQTTSTITVTNAPAAITGTLTVCVGSTSTLGDFDGGGTWASSAVGFATIGSSSGTVTGVAAGTSMITYSLTGCFTTAVVTVNALPSGISGATSVCNGASTGLTDVSGSGQWSSSNTAVVSVGSVSGTATGIASGSAIITFTLATGGCQATMAFTVNPMPSAITGTVTICSGNNTTLTDGPPGGSWISSNTAVASVGSGSGFVSALTAGTSIITYKLPAGCSATTTLTVNQSPAAIGGITTLCIGFTSGLTDVVAGGTWGSSNTSVATIGTGGVVTGVASGTAIITYDKGLGCLATTAVTVNLTPTAITGTTTFCSSASTILGNSVSGGVWSSSNTSVATIGSAYGVFAGVAAGTAVVTYTLGVGCYVTASVSVLAGPSAISGSAGLCIGSPITLSDVAGGTWSSSATSVATVGTSSGLVSGVSIGTSVISYVFGNGCFADVVVTVSPASAAAIGGLANVCVGQPVAFTDATSGGSWTSSNTARATVGSGSGVVTGISAGIVTISYSVTTPCGFAVAIKTVTVNTLPVVSAITGSLVFCTGGNSTLADATLTGVWSSNNTAVATIGSASGIATGVTTGSAIISYTVTNLAGCSVSQVATVIVTTPAAATITPPGPITFCTGASVLLQGPVGSGLTYQWLLGGINITGATSSSFLVNTASGNYAVMVNSGIGCNATSAVVSVSVNPSPVVIPSVAVAASPGTLLCVVSSPVTFTATSSGGGTSPAFQWYVNGVATVAGNPYTYSPLNGDVVKCRLTSDDACAFPDTAFASLPVTISPRVTPSVSIVTTNAGGIVCSGQNATFTAVPVYGGAAPTYLWTLNGVNVATGPIYINYTPVTGDIVVCTMTSDYSCITTSVVSSPPVTVTVVANVVNSVSIHVSQSAIISGAVDTFTATGPYAGISPAYQWYINGSPVPGATSAIYVTNALANGDTVTCALTSSDPCAEPNIAFSSGIIMSVGSNNVATFTATGGLVLVPNPNRGDFTITGSLLDASKSSVEIKIINTLGQTIYAEAVPAKGGLVDAHISLGQSSVPSGLYLVSVTSGGEHVVFHVVIEQ